MPLFTCEIPNISHGTNWKPSIVRLQQLGECTSIRWNATRQECGHRLERSGRSKSTTRLLPRVLRKVLVILGIHGIVIDGIVLGTVIWLEGSFLNFHPKLWDDDLFHVDVRKYLFNWVVCFAW